VAKLYHRPPTAEKTEKLKTMVRLANPHLLALAAWPKVLLYEARSRVLAGFVMPRLSECQPIQHLYNPVQRLRSFSRSGWNFQLRAAVNLAAAFDEVHKAGCLVGDVNQSNVQVSTKALVRLIDCDSFQVRANGKAFLCEVGVAHYIPPELQGKSLRGLVRTENHDRFGLAVLIYQLLFVGRHPYAGVYSGTGDPSFEQLISEFRFAQGPMARSWNMAPPPHTPTFADIPTEVGNLFRRAFEKGSDAGTRPRSAEWMQELQRLEQALTVCSTDPGHQYWRGAHSCVWCRLADHGGPEYYFGVAGGIGSFAVDEVKLQDAVRRLSACGPFDFPYDRAKFKPARLRPPQPLPEDMDDHRSISVYLSIATGFGAVSLAFGLIHEVMFASGLLCTLVFGIWLAIHIATSPWHREHRRRKSARNLARYNVDTIEGQWKETIKNYHRAHSQTATAIRRSITGCRELGARYQSELQRLTANAEAAARTRHLRLYLISDAEIPKIGAGRKQALASYGIFTAADLDDYRIHNVKGFGDVLLGNLFAWKEGVLRQFRFDPITALSPAEQRTLTVKLRNEQQQILADLSRNVANLESLAPSCKASLHKLIPELQRTVSWYAQAEVDLSFISAKR
jgi:DNA-binding helix-hairpin-helix protein with protein kinase domain